MQSFLIGLLVSEPVGTIQAELSVPREAAAARVLQVLPLAAPLAPSCAAQP